MRLSCEWVAGLALVAYAAGAVALDVPQKVHHTKTEPHLRQTHRAAVHQRGCQRTPAAHTGGGPCFDDSRFGDSCIGSPYRFCPLCLRSSSSPCVAQGAAPSLLRALHRQLLRHRRHFAGDITTGEDPVVRQAAIDALGDMNGTAVVIDPSNGRILAMVNQKLALSPGAEPCSTIKLTVALAALSEGLVTRDTPVQLPGFRMNMTQALAKSNNLYFEELGRELGFERVRHYATQFGLGELAGYNIPGEQLGEYPDQPIPAVRRRRGPNVQLRPGRLAHPAAARRLRRRHRQRRNALLSAAPHHA